MTNFWPTGLDLTDTSSPFEILQSARQEWTDQSKGALTLVIQKTKSANGNHVLIVHAKHVPSNRTVTLFSVIHRPGAPYPAKIQPREDGIPDILKKSYYRPGLDDLDVIPNPIGEQVTNKWVCDTPAEFRAQLKEVFNLGSLTSDVFSLVTGNSSSSESEDDPEKTEDVSGGADDVGF